MRRVRRRMFRCRRRDRRAIENVVDLASTYEALVGYVNVYLHSKENLIITVCTHSSLVGASEKVFFATLCFGSVEKVAGQVVWQDACRRFFCFRCELLADFLMVSCTIGQRDGRLGAACILIQRSGAAAICLSRQANIIDSTNAPDNSYRTPLSATAKTTCGMLRDKGTDLRPATPLHPAQ